MQDNDFNELKSNIDDDFLPYTFQLFNALGNIDLQELGKNAQQEEREAKQYMTLESVKRNLPKVFGIKNDFFAEMLFSFISDHAPLSHIINYHQFLSRLEIFWPKKDTVPLEKEDPAAREWRERNARLKHRAALR